MNKKSRTAFVALVALAALAAGCAGSLARGAMVVSTSLHVLSDVEEAVVSADRAEKEALMKEVDAGRMTEDGANAKNDAWERGLARVVTTFRVAKDALVTASHAVDVARRGGQADWQKSVDDVAAAMASLTQTLTDAGVHVPGVN